MAVHERLLRGDAPPPEAPPSRASAPGPLPAALAAATRAARVRRARGGARGAARAWDAAVGDERRLVLLAGEAGIGKSRLAAEFTREVHRDGAVVLYGRFDETGPGAYEPVLEMLRGWSGGAALTGPAQRLGPRAADLAALLPELGAPAGASAIRSRRAASSASACSTRSPRCSPRSRPARRCCSCSTTCSGPTARRCSSLRHLMRAPQPRRAMFLGTYREAELGDGHPLPDADRLAAARGDAHRTCRSTGSRAARSPSWWRRSARRRPRPPSSPRCTARPRATRSSSRRSSAT